MRARIQFTVMVDDREREAIAFYWDSPPPSQRWPRRKATRDEVQTFFRRYGDSYGTTALDEALDEMEERERDEDDD